MSVSRYFQKENVDVHTASEFLSNNLFLLEDKWHNAETGFHELFEQETEIAESVNSEWKSLCYHLTSFSDCSSYFMADLYIPIFDSIVTNVKRRFSAGASELYRLNIILPKECISNAKTKERLNADIEFISKMWQDHGKWPWIDSFFKSDLKDEMNIWTAKWERENYNKTQLHSSTIECLCYCIAEMFSTIKHLLIMIAPLPASAATAEK